MIGLESGLSLGVVQQCSAWEDLLTRFDVPSLTWSNCLKNRLVEKQPNIVLKRRNWFDWLNYWLIDWLTDWLIDWLIDVFVCPVHQLVGWYQTDIQSCRCRGSRWNAIKDGDCEIERQIFAPTTWRKVSVFVLGTVHPSQFDRNKSDLQIRPTGEPTKILVQTNRLDISFCRSNKNVSWHSILCQRFYVSEKTFCRPT